MNLLVQNSGAFMAPEDRQLNTVPITDRFVLNATATVE